MKLAETIRRRQSRVLKILSALSSADRPAKKQELLGSLRDELERQNRGEREALSPLGGRSPKLARLFEESQDREQEIGDLFREVELIASPEALQSTIDQLAPLIEAHFDEQNVLLFPEIVSELRGEEIDELCARLEQEGVKKAA